MTWPSEPTMWLLFAVAVILLVNKIFNDIGRIR